jgi:threonine aldolase
MLVNWATKQDKDSTVMANEPRIDLRSDTVTRPSAAMLEAMVAAPVGDDVFGEDPTVNKLQERVSSMFGMEAGLFVPSGTMSNQLAIHVLTEPGQEVIIDELGHVFNYETAAASLLSSVQLRPLKGHRGKLEPGQVKAAVRPRNDWDPISKVLSLENTTNKGGGAFYTRDELTALHSVARENDLLVHMDGARIWNAITASGIEPSFFGGISDTISVCFSKGLGAPVGSMLLASTDRIKKARRARKMWGGGMRQVGILAAAADFALDHVWPLMGDDHRRAKEFARAIDQSSAFEVDPDTVSSNIVLFRVVNGDTMAALDAFNSKGVGMTQFGPDVIRATFHYQVSDQDLDQIIAIIQQEFP